MGAPATLRAGAARAHRASVRRGLEAFGTAAVLAGVVALAAVGAFLFTGHAVTVDRGDLVVTKVVPAGEVRPGDVVTFSDPTRAGRSVTHRVVSVSRRDLVTRDVAAAGTGKWSIAENGEVGQQQLVIPGAARAIAWLTGAPGRILLISLPLLFLAAFAVRRFRAG